MKTFILPSLGIAIGIVWLLYGMFWKSIDNDCEHGSLFDPATYGSAIMRNNRWFARPWWVDVIIGLLVIIGSGWKLIVLY